MTDGTVQVSVVIPVCNGERYLAGAVASVQRQAYQPLEILIIDDGSTDGTAKLAATFTGDVHYQYQPNRGPPAARNQGLRLARGDLIAFLDADDLWTETKLKLQLPRLTDHPGADIVIGRAQNLELAGTISGKDRFEARGSPRTVLSLGCALVRRRVFDRVGFFDESLFQCDDWDWFMRVRELGLVPFMHPEVVLFRRLHGQNVTRDIERGNRHTLAMIRKSIDRRRQSGGGTAAPLPSLPVPGGAVAAPVLPQDGQTREEEPR